MSRESSAEPSVHHDSVRESAASRVEPTSFSGADRMDLYKSFDQTAGNNGIPGRSAAGAGDGNLPSHLSFDNSIYNSSVYGAVSGDGSYKVASASDTPFAPPKGDSLTKIENQYMKEAGDFAFGDTLTNAQAQAGKEKLQILTQEVFRNQGEEGLKALAGRFNDQALDRYGEKAFEKAGPQFDQSLANVKVTQNKDGSTQVQYDFAQPNSAQKNSVIFQLPKPELGTVHPEVFPDSTKPTYKI